MIRQYALTVHTRGRGAQIITEEVLAALGTDLDDVNAGLLHCFLQHTSASISINENADPSVRADFRDFEEHLVPRDFPYQHKYEGDDDMPAHIKSSLFGCQLSVPVRNGALALGTWQGIYLNEHRDRGSARRLLLTLLS